MLLAFFCNDIYNLTEVLGQFVLDPQCCFNIIFRLEKYVKFTKHMAKWA